MSAEIDSFVGKIHHGNCVDGMTQVPAQSVDLVFADPPFNIGYEYDEYDDRLQSEHYLRWSADWMREVHRILKPNGTFWLAIGDEYAAELKVEAKKIGFNCRSWVIWYYTFGVHCKNKFARSHAHLFYFVKDAKNFTFNRDSIAVPSARQLVYRDKRNNPAGRLPDDTWILRPQDCDQGFNPDEDTWYFPRVAGTFKERAGFHGCQMPEQLLGRIIRASSNPHDIIVDPFSGSSTTLVVAKKLDRRYFGFELSQDYVDRGSARLATVSVGDKLEGAEEPKVSAPSTADGKSIYDEKPRGVKSKVKASSKKAQRSKGTDLFDFVAVHGPDQSNLSAKTDS
jgi:DNA modification methylase